MADSTQASLEWRLALVDVTAFHEDAALVVDVEPGTFRVNANVDLDEEQQVLVVPVKVEVLRSEDSDDVMAGVELVCVFQFKSFEGARNDEGAVRIDRSQVIAALGIAFSTARGVLIGRARHPVFSQAVLPILSPREQFESLINVSDKPWIGTS